VLRAKVLDLSRVLAGPLCAMILGDLGAEVIKVERPGEGDETRGWGPPFDAGGMSAYFRATNRNKKSVALDLTIEGDRQVLLSLLSDADVVIENFLPAVRHRLGLSPDELLASYPSLIWCSISGFGAASDRPGYDFLIQAEAGWMAITGEPEGQPMKVGVALGDVIAGKDAAISVLAALAARQNEELGPDSRRITVSLLDSARAALVNVAQNVLVSGSDARRWGNAHPNLVPYQLFEASDRPFVIAVGSDAQWRSCVEALELHTLAEDGDLTTNAGRVVNGQRVARTIAERVQAKPARHWVQLLTRAGVPSGVVKTVVESLEDSGASALTGVPPSVPGAVRLPPPNLDEHGAAIRSLGWRAFQP
jgi:crotonobetainyl-CoA:carnitine CoA-transferase CaiB-like acyl-CoA transferase